MKDDGAPGTDDIRRQLKRMLAGRRFKKMPARAALLEYVVESALTGVELTEAVLGPKLFPGWLPDISDDVRVTASHLRKTLADYYREEGADDYVRIDLPQGPKYRPEFRFNPRSESIAHYRKGQEHMRRMRHAHMVIARQEFIDSHLTAPGYAPAASAQADAEFRLQFIRRCFVEDALSAQFNFRLIEEDASKAIELDPEYWHGHYMMGVVHACGRRWEEAAKAFETALALNPEECMDRFWYPAFLLAIGEVERGLAMAEAGATRRPDNFTAQFGLGLLCYLGGECGKASSVLENLTQLEMESWEDNILSALLHIASGNFAGAHDALHPRYRPAEMGQRTFEEIFPGLSAVVEAGLGNRERVAALLAGFKEGSKRKPEDLALAHMANGEMDEAIAALEDLCFYHHPLLLWLHLLPLMEPLRPYPGFKALLARIGAPGAKRLIS